MTVDVDKLRAYMIDYYGTAAFSGMPVAILDASKVQLMSAEELVHLAMKEKIDLTKFAVEK